MIQLTSYLNNLDSIFSSLTPLSFAVNTKKCPLMPNASHPISQLAHQILNATGA